MSQGISGPHDKLLSDDVTPTQGPTVIEEAVAKLITRKNHWGEEANRAAVAGDMRRAAIYGARGWALHEAIEIIRGERTPEGEYVGACPVEGTLFELMGVKDFLIGNANLPSHPRPAGEGMCESCGDRPAKRTLLLRSQISDTEEKTFSSNSCIPCRDAFYVMSKDDWVQTWVLDEKLYEGP